MISVVSTLSKEDPLSPSAGGGTIRLVAGPGRPEREKMNVLSIS